MGELSKFNFSEPGIDKFMPVAQNRKSPPFKIFFFCVCVRSGMKKRQMAPTVTVCNMAFTFREKEKNFRVCYQDRR